MKRISVVALAAIALTGVGCVQSSPSSDSKVIQDRVSRGGAATYTGQVNPTTGQVTPVETSYVVGSSVAGDYQAVVKALVAPQIDPQYLGCVDPQSGVLMQAFIDINTSTGAVIPSKSSLTLQIKDEFVGQADPNTGKPIPPISMTLAGSSGTLTGNQLRMVFQDCAGEVVIQGTYNNMSPSMFAGVVTFTNSKKSDCKTPLVGAGQPNVLGSFQVQTCGFMRCQ